MIGRGRAGVWLGVVLLAFFGTVPTVHAAELISLPQGKWGCELGAEKLLQGINAGLISKGWVITNKDTKGKIVAQVIVRDKHTLVVDIAYTSETFQITYKSSNNLNYSVSAQGAAVIHKNANRWLGFIQNDIALQLGALCTL